MTLDEARALIAADLFATERCGIRVDALENGEACLSMPVTPAHLNANGVVQGGAIYTLADTAFAVAANAYGGRVVNRSADITYLRPGTGAMLYARAKCLARGSTMGLYQIEVFDENQKLIAHVTANGFGTGR